MSLSLELVIDSCLLCCPPNSEGPLRAWNNVRGPCPGHVTQLSVGIAEMGTNW